MVINSKDDHFNEKPYDEAIKELFCFITGGSSGQFEIGPDSEEIKQARADLDKFLDENIKDRDLEMSKELAEFMSLFYQIIKPGERSTANHG